MTTPIDLAKYFKSANTIFRFRKALATDDPSVSKILLKSFSFTNRLKLKEICQQNPFKLLDLGNVRERRMHEQVYILETNKNIPVGTFAILRPFSKINDGWLPDFTHIKYLAVDPTYRYIGLSKALIALAIDSAAMEPAKGIAIRIFQKTQQIQKCLKDYNFKREILADEAYNGVTEQAFAFRNG